MDHAELFLDALHVEKNMAPAIGAEKANGIRLYHRALNTPSISEVNSIKN